MHIPGLFPLQAWMDRIQSHISRGENNKARFSALLLPVFEAAGCLSMVGRICFRSARKGDEEQGSFSILNTAGKTVMLAWNVLFAPYYGFKNPKGNLDYHRLSGLIVPLQEESKMPEKPFTFVPVDTLNNQSLFDESPRDTFDEDSYSAKHSNSPFLRPSKSPYSGPSVDPIPSPFLLQPEIPLLHPVKELQERKEEETSSPIPVSPKNRKTPLKPITTIPSPLKTSPRTPAISPKADLFTPCDEKNESELMDQTASISIPETVEEVQTETSTPIHSPPKDEEKLLAELAIKLPESSSPLSLSPVSPVKTITVTPIKLTPSSSHKTPSSGIQNRLTQLQQQTSPLQKLDARQEIEQERKRQLHQTPMKGIGKQVHIPEDPSVTQEAVVLMLTPFELPTQTLFDNSTPTPTNSPLEEKEVDAHSDLDGLFQEEDSSSHSDHEQSDSGLMDLFFSNSSSKPIEEIDLGAVESDNEEGEVVTTDSVDVTSHDQTAVTDATPLGVLPEQTIPHTPAKLTTTFLDLGVIKSTQIADIEFNTPEKRPSSLTNTEFSWLTERNIDFNQSFELKVDEKKGTINFKASKKTSIDSKFIDFLQKKLDGKAFEKFYFAPLYALRGNLQKMVERDLIKDKGTTLSSVEKRLNELIVRWWIKEDYRKQKLSENCRFLIQYIIAKHHLDDDEKSEGRTQERLMRQSNSAQTSQNLEKFHFHDQSFKKLSIYDYYAVLKTFLMNFPAEQKAIFEGCQQSDSKESLIQAIQAIPNPADRALAIDLVSLLWTTLHKVWAPEDGLNLNELNDSNREDFYKTANSMLIGGKAIASLLCPFKVIEMHSVKMEQPIHTHLIDLILDYPLHFEELRKSLVS
ncbi:hypothetical protein PNK_1206 [Candidatus Protochlamydia naegleriophila]|uniref:Uncharacterized protein n=1 Tax=Candidatus Protochlamydia naegleriophila TaxID=389348 RepID=A0A0U5JCI0_9BACT|nr:hypothetical protein [Candidatus Protochlamydia naegleriophila]CUI16823.1 hypothetical protein PNK_1206 [Candidatus Protochlamydia naegleriophila]